MSRSSMRLSALALAAAGMLVVSSSSWAAADGARARADSQYKRDVAACKSGQSGQVMSACMKEAGAARQLAISGRLEEGNGQFEQNRLARCNALPAGDQAACRAEMSGQGQTQGSVPSGGVMREITVPDSSGGAGGGYAPAGGGYAPAGGGMAPRM